MFTTLQRNHRPDNIAKGHLCAHTKNGTSESAHQCLESMISFDSSDFSSQSQPYKLPYKSDNTFCTMFIGFGVLQKLFISANKSGDKKEYFISSH